MSSLTASPATIQDLYREPGKAELIGGRIVQLMPTGRKPSRVAFRIPRSLSDYAEAIGNGEAFSDNTGFVVRKLSSGRQSFAPDASFHPGPFPADEMRFITGAPAFAVEVCSGNDYGPAAEKELAAKRADYFEAGTSVVWDVDVVNRLVRKYRSDRPEEPETYSVGVVANAEPAVTG